MDSLWVGLEQAGAIPTLACAPPAPQASEFTGRFRTIGRSAQVAAQVVKCLFCNLCVSFQDRSSISKDVTLNPSYSLRLEWWWPNLGSSRGLKRNQPVQ